MGRRHDGGESADGRSWWTLSLPKIQMSSSLSNIKDDDEFQDFQVQDWDESAENGGFEVEQLWQADWDEEEEFEDGSEFTMQLRAELEKEQNSRLESSTNNGNNNVDMQE